MVAVAADDGHRFSKRVVDRIALIEGQGVRGDAHCGVTVQHRSRVRSDPTKPNLRQVHLIPSELFADLRGRGSEIGPADLGENVTTEGADLMALPTGTVLRIGAEVRLEMTGLRNPCAQIEAFCPGLLSVGLTKGDDGSLIRRAGIMAVVRRGGRVAAGDRIVIETPPLPHHPLEVV